MQLFTGIFISMLLRFSKCFRFFVRARRERGYHFFRVTNVLCDCCNGRSEVLQASYRVAVIKRDSPKLFKAATRFTEVKAATRFAEVKTESRFRLNAYHVPRSAYPDRLSGDTAWTWLAWKDIQEIFEGRSQYSSSASRKRPSK